MAPTSSFSISTRNTTEPTRRLCPWWRIASAVLWLSRKVPVGFLAQPMGPVAEMERMSAAAEGMCQSGADVVYPTLIEFAEDMPQA